MHESIDPERFEKNKNLEEVLDTHEDAFDDKIDTVADLRDYKYALGLAKLLVIPDNKEPIEHIRDLSLASKESFRYNAPSLGHKQVTASKILADHHEIDWKTEVREKEEERRGKLSYD